jgi:hypothetical protein
MTLYDLSQLLIALLGVPAVLCSQMPSVKLKRLAPLLGLAGQPAWFYFAWTARGTNGESSLGAFSMCILYTAAWGLGLWFMWIKPWLSRRAIEIYYRDALKATEARERK